MWVGLRKQTDKNTGGIEHWIYFESKLIFCFQRLFYVRIRKIGFTLKSECWINIENKCWLYVEKQLVEHLISFQGGGGGHYVFIMMKMCIQKHYNLDFKGFYYETNCVKTKYLSNFKTCTFILFYFLLKNHSFFPWLITY